jgi:hypothetical protein
VKLCAAACALLAAILAVGVASTRAAASLQTVAVTLTTRTVSVAAANVLAGTVKFTIANHGKVARNFAIAGKRTAPIPAGASATLSVTLGTGFHQYSSLRRDRHGRVTGLVDALAPCTNPVATTVTVRMTQSPGSIALAQSTIPCGNVTFVITNAGTLVDKLRVFADYQGETSASPEIAPGQTVTLTIRFLAKGIASYVSDDFPPQEQEDGRAAGEQGQFAIV